MAIDSASHSAEGCYAKVRGSTPEIELSVGIAFRQGIPSLYPGDHQHQMSTSASLVTLRGTYAPCTGTLSRPHRDICDPAPPRPRLVER